MKKSKVIIFLVLLILINSCFALNLKQHEIIVSIDSQGKTNVTENYYLEFAYEFQKEQFMENAKKNSSSLGAWRADYDFFYTPLTKNEANIKKSTIQIDEKNNLISLNYELRESLASIIETQPREDTWKIKENIFDSFIETGLIKIPQNTFLIFQLPFGAKIKQETLEQLAVIEGNRIILNGIASNSIPLIYSVQKSISPDFGAEIIQTILSNEVLFLLVLFFGIIIIGLIYLKKEKIEKKVENYIVNHSEIEGKEAEEFDLDFIK